MVARFQDAWARQQAAIVGTDPDRFTVATPTDPRHGDKSEAPAPLMMDAPISQGGGELYSDALFENRGHLPQPSLIDRTPVEGQGTPEETGHGYGGCYTPGENIAKLAFYRGRDDGAADKQTRTDTKYRKSDDNFYGLSIDAFRDTPIARMGVGNPALGTTRGINGFSVNDGDSGRPWAWRVNMPSWHLGVYEESKIDRRFEPPSMRRDQMKMIEADIVTIIGDAPPPAKSDTYASPFSALQKFMPKRRKVRGIRRDPGPFDEDQLAMPTPEYVGMGVDGLVVP
jgi:hypothetical protein